MGKRSKTAGGTLAADSLSLAALNHHIGHLVRRYQDQRLNSQLRRDSFGDLIKLEAERERLHSIPAPDRHFPRRVR